MARQKKILGAIIHPIALLCPTIEGDKFEELVESIHTQGLLMPVTILYPPESGKPITVIDGHNRMRALAVLAKRYPKRWKDYDYVYSAFCLQDAFPIDEPGALERYVAGVNLTRRQINKDQEAALKARLMLDDIRQYARQQKEAGQKAGGGDRKSENRLNHKCGSSDRDTKKMHANSTAGRMASVASVGRRLAESAIKLIDASKETEKASALLDAVCDGSVSLNKALKQLSPPKPKAKAKSKAKKQSVRKDEWRLISQAWLESDPEGFAKSLRVWLKRAES